MPNAGQPYSAIGGNPDLAAVNIPGGGGAIPCTGHNSGQCIGLAEEKRRPMVTGGGASSSRQQPDGHRLRRQHRVVADAEPVRPGRTYMVV